MSDDSSHLTWYDDLPVREIQENIAKLDDDPRASRLSLEQRVTLVYESAIARVLLEQCERYDDLRSDIEFDGESFELLRTLALERARVIAELFLSARREDVGIADHSFQGEGLLGAILALGVLKSCFVALTGDDPDRRLLLSADELDALVLNPLMDAWWEYALPRDEIAPPQFGSGAPPPAPPPTDAADARAPSRRCARPSRRALTTTSRCSTHSPTAIEHARTRCASRARSRRCCRQTSSATSTSGCWMRR